MTASHQPEVSPFAAVLFDCDGVLIDSESIATRALHRSLLNLDMTITEDEVAERFTGHSFPTCVKMIEADLGGPIPDQFMADNARFFEQTMRAELVTMTGIESVLEQLTLPFAVVTNSRTDELAMKLSVAGLAHFFPSGRRFDSQAMGVAKPDPAIYRQAAAALGFAIEDCLVVEDSIPGLTAASHAGAHVWAYRPHADDATMQSLAIRHTLNHWQEFHPNLRALSC